MKYCVAIIIVLANAFGCGASQPSRPASLDPSNPNARASSSPQVTQSLQAEPAENDAHEASIVPSQSNTSTGAVYICPMHPEVVQNSPGRCPKCGMNLVPRESTTKPPMQPTAPAKKTPSKSTTSHTGH